MNDNIQEQVRELNERITALEDRAQDGKNHEAINDVCNINEEHDNLRELPLAFGCRLEQERSYMNNTIWYAIIGISITSLILSIISIVKQVIL